MQGAREVSAELPSGLQRLLAAVLLHMVKSTAGREKAGVLLRGDVWCASYSLNDSDC